MKTKLFLLPLSLALWLGGCDSKGDEGISTGNGPAACFTAQLPGATRAAGDAYSPSRYVMEIYEGETASGTPLQRIEQAGGTFNAALTNKTTYTCLFWADSGIPDNAQAGDYDASNLKSVKVKTGATPSNPAYAGMTQVTVGVSSESAYRVSLTHAVAKASCIQTEGFTTENNTLRVTFPAAYSLNVADLSTAKTADAATYTFTGIAAQSQGKTIAVAYLFAPTATAELMNISVQINGETPKEISNVPLHRNHNTNIRGAYSDLLTATFTCGLTEEWNAPDYEEFIAADRMKFTIDLTAFPDKSYVLPFAPDATTGDYILQVDWGDGSAPTTVPSGLSLSDPAATALMTHVYAEQKPYQITVSTSQGNASWAQIPRIIMANKRNDDPNAKKLRTMDTPLLNTASTMEYCFRYSSLTEIPADLFVKNTGATNFGGCFEECDNLTTIPAGLFDKNTKATDLS